MKYVLDNRNDELIITFDDGHSEHICSRLIQAVRRVDLMEWGKSITANYVSKQLCDTLENEDYEVIAEYLEDLMLSNNGEHEIAVICHVLGEDSLER